MPDDDSPMSKEQAQQYQNELSRLSQSHVEDAYRAAFSDCALSHGKLPGPSTIQESALALAQGVESEKAIDIDTTNRLFYCLAL
jgi:hypothetical protein